MFVKIKQRKLRDDTAIDVLLLSSYRESGSAMPKHRFIKQWTVRKSDWIDPTRHQWFFDDIEEEGARHHFSLALLFLLCLGPCRSGFRNEHSPFFRS